MPIFPSGFGTQVTDPAALDSDDAALWSVDGVVKNVAPSAARGHLDPSHYAALSATVLNACEATTGFTAVGLASGSLILDTTNKSTGAASVSGLFETDLGVLAQLYYTFTTPEAIGTRTLVALDIQWRNTTSADTTVAEDSYVVVADGVNLTGNRQTTKFTVAAENWDWATVVVPLSGLTQIKSIGWEKPTTVGSGNYSAYVNIDNIRFVAETGLDRALGSSVAGHVVVPANYTSSANQLRPVIPATKAIVDPVNGVFSGLNKFVHIHDHLAHVVGAETGLVDVADEITAIIASAQRGQIVRGSPGAVYRFDRQLVLRNDGVILDFTGSTLMLRYLLNSPFLTIKADDTTIIGGLWLGYYPVTWSGDNMQAQAGTPTVSGTTMVINAQNEEARYYDNGGWDMAMHWARHLPQQLGLADDGLGPRCYWEFSLSDSAQVTNDCVLSIYDDDDGTLLTSSTVTLTGSAATYRISYVPTDLHMRLRPTVKKATATANTITVHSTTGYGEVEYNGTYDAAACIRLTAANRTTLKDMWIEGHGGDGIQCSAEAVNYVHIDGVTSRGCRRQGLSFNQGSHFLIENSVMAETGRSGIDHEPFSDTWSISHVHLRNLTMWNNGSYALALGNWARNRYFVIEEVDVYNCRIGLLYGGAREGHFKGIRNWSPPFFEGDVGGTHDFDIKGQNLVVEDCRSVQGVVCLTDTNDADNDDGVVLTYTPSGVILRRFTFIGKYARSRVTTAVGFRIEDFSFQPEGEAFADGTPSEEQYGPATMLATDDFSGLHFGEYAKQFSNSHAGLWHSSVRMAGGFDHADDAVYRARSLSGGTVAGNNLRGVGVSVSNGATTHAVAFPNSRTVGAFTQVALGGGDAIAGSLTPSTNYYYRVAARGRVAGPRTFGDQITAALGAGHTSAYVTVRGPNDTTNDVLIDSFTILRGTTTGGPYTHRYDVIPTAPFASLALTFNSVIDKGTTLEWYPAFALGTGYAVSYPVQTGSWTAADMSGHEPDVNYMVTVETTWNAGYVWITSKAVSGFTINFATAAGASDKVSWFLAR